MKTYFVYMAANEKDGNIYIGVTNDLIRRFVEHKTKQVKGYTERHNIDKLVWYEETDSIEGAILREKQMKKWNRN
jgi:putative endonuclease